jgi:hypothetical protein
MPALFAYLIALCLLLGGGVGALNWLAAPEPMKVAAKASPKSKLSSPPTQARPEEISAAALPATSLDATAADTAAAVAPSPSADIGKAASASIVPPAQETEKSVATVERDAQPESVTPPPDQPARSAHAEIRADEAKPAEKAVVPAKPSPRVLTASASSPADNAARPSKRHRQASNRPEKRKLELMTLRTIQFDDGRRVTQLIPYRGREHALAFGDDD